MKEHTINETAQLLCHSWFRRDIDLWPNSWFEHFTWTHGSTLLAALLAAAVTVTGVLLGIRGTAATNRRERRATLYAEALRAVADYLEGPYRVRRKDGSSERRAAISGHLSDVKSRVDYYQALLQLHAPPEVSATFDAYVTAARGEAGKQMKDAWLLPPVKEDSQMSLGVAYPREDSEDARTTVVAFMRRDLANR